MDKLKKLLESTLAKDFKIIKEETYILNEGIEEIKKYYPKIDDNMIKTLVALDPTYQGGEQLGKYGKWILNLYNKGKLKEEDFYKVTEYLTTFVNNLSKMPNKDIMTYKSLPDLAKIIQGFEGQKDISKKQQVRDIKKGAKKVMETGEWLVIQPTTEESACYYGANTKWCTASKENSMFNHYNEQGPLYIFIRKSTGAKYQFHAETFSFMDATDKPIAPKKVIGEPDVLDVINNAFDAKINDIDFEENNPIIGLNEDEEGQAVIVIDDVWNDFILNLFDTDNYIKNILSDYIEGNEIDIDDIKYQYSEYFNIDEISDELDDFCDNLTTKYKKYFNTLMDKVKEEIINIINSFSKFFKIYDIVWNEDYQQLFLYVKTINGSEFFYDVIIDWFMNENQTLYLDNIFEDICSYNVSKQSNTDKIIKVFCEGLKKIIEKNIKAKSFNVEKNPKEDIVETYLKSTSLRFAFNPMNNNFIICDDLHNPIPLNESADKYITGILSPNLVEITSYISDDYNDSKEIVENLLGKRFKKIFKNHYEIII